MTPSGGCPAVPQKNYAHALLSLTQKPAKACSLWYSTGSLEACAREGSWGAQASETQQLNTLSPTLPFLSPPPIEVISSPGRCWGNLAEISW